jgi:hypothetical protein
MTKKIFKNNKLFENVSFLRKVMTKNVFQNTGTKIAEFNTFSPLSINLFLIPITF